MRNVSIDHAQCDDCACTIDFLIPRGFSISKIASDELNGLEIIYVHILLDIIIIIII